MEKKWLTYLPILIWTLIITKLSTGPGVQLELGWDDILGIDKIGHAVFYGIHTLLLAWTFLKNKLFSDKKQLLLIAFISSAVLGILLEIVQYSFYPERYFEILDIIANIIGSFIGTIVFRNLKSFN